MTVSADNPDVVAGTLNRLHWPLFNRQNGTPVATPNYGYEKRQRELAKKKKKEEKLKAKSERKVGDGGPEDGSPEEETDTPAQPTQQQPAA